MQGAAQKGNMSPDRLAAGKTADGLVDNSLKNRGRKIFLGSAVIDQGLNVGFGKNAATRRNGIERMVVLGIFV